MDTKIISILLGAGKPKRGRSLSALRKVHADQSVIDRLLNIFKPISTEVVFVGGYRISSLMNKYPELTFYKNNLWKSTGSFYSLSFVNIDEAATYLISYTDVVFTSHLTNSLLKCDSDVAVAADWHPYDRYENRPPLDMKKGGFLSISESEWSVVDEFEISQTEIIEIAGVMKISGRILMQLPELLAKNPEAKSWHLHQLVEALNSQGEGIEIVDASGQWAELDAPQDLANFTLSSKAKTLSRLYGATSHSKVLPQVSFSVKDWNSDSQSIINKIQKLITDKHIVVRSSSSLEDCWDSSRAGAFLSILSVENTPSAIRDSIEKVIFSYESQGGDDEVLVQPMLKDVSAAGVIMTRTLSCGAPYYTINYDLCGSTDSVTSGVGGNLQTCIVHNSRKTLPVEAPPELARLLPAVSEIIRICGHDSLDIEFGVDAHFNIYILQVRPIAIDHSGWRLDDEDVNKAVFNGKNQIRKLQAPHPELFGTKTVLSNMADWNPAEIIGVSPRQLSYSLYRFLITDEVWAQQRSEFGYKDVRPSPLIYLVAGHPYVNVQASFSSFIPADIPDDLAHRLVDFYLDKLRRYPHLHDKVEFEIVYTCLCPGFSENSEELREVGFTDADICILKESLRRINSNGFQLIKEVQSSIERLNQDFKDIKYADSCSLKKAFHLLHRCKMHGTVAFSHLARMGFISVAFLRALNMKGVISDEELDGFFRSLKTVAKSLSMDYQQVSVGEMSYQQLVDKYGHLRPGTYDINSPCYSSAPEQYFPKKSIQEDEKIHVSDSKFIFSDSVLNYLTDNAAMYGFPADAETVIDFFRQSIEGREYSKFIFTRNLSMALELIADFASQLGLSRAEISNVSIFDLQSVLIGQSGSDVKKWLQTRSEEGRTFHQISQATELPSLIMNAEDIFAFHLGQSQPNFVGTAHCTAEVIRIINSSCLEHELEGKIVLIEQADPGYDWLFGQNIAGLVTCFGGANSHMAIRAAELALPAAIGVGEQLYNRLVKSKLVKLDCSSRILEILKCV